MEKVALVAFNGELMCFAHLLLNAFDMKERNYQVEIIMEGSATKLIKTLHEDSSLPFAAMYQRAVTDGLITAVCDACASKMGAKESARAQGLALVNDIKGHPSLAKYIDKGYRIITF